MTRRRAGARVSGREPNRPALIITADRRRQAAFALEHELTPARLAPRPALWPNLLQLRQGREILAMSATDNVRPPLEMIEGDPRIRQTLWKPDAAAFPPEQTRLGRTGEKRVRVQ